MNFGMKFEPNISSTKMGQNRFEDHDPCRETINDVKRSVLQLI